MECYDIYRDMVRAQRDEFFKYASERFNDEEMAKAMSEIGNGAQVSRYKGLGEMNPQQLWETTMDPATRVMKKITIEDAILADQLFSILMGEDVEPRKQYIIEHAHEVINLDV